MHLPRITSARAETDDAKIHIYTYRERNRATLVKHKHVCDDNSDERRILVFFFFFCEEKNNFFFFFIIIEESNPSSRLRDGIEQRVSIRRVLAWNRDADAGRVGV
jgi:hypothetical protein